MVFLLYLSSQEFKGHPNLKDEALQKQDLMLLSNYLTHATEKVLPIIQVGNTKQPHMYCNVIVNDIPYHDEFVISPIASVSL